MFASSPAANPICVATLGDSLTAWTDAIGPGYFKGWVQRLQESYSNRRIDNFAVGGYVSSSIRDRWLYQVKDCGYKRITVLGGINDIVGSNTDSVVIANLDTIYDQAIAAGVHVTAFTIFPFSFHVLWNPTRQGYLESVNSHIIAKGAANSTAMTVIDTYSMLGTGGQPNKLNSGYDNGDGLHLNSSGHQFLYEYLLDIFYE